MNYISLELMEAQKDNIIKLYKDFEDKKPIMLFDIQEKKIYAYPYKEFALSLNIRSQKKLLKQYQTALSKNQIVIFVKDNEKRKLLSYNLDYPTDNERN